MPFHKSHGFPYVEPPRHDELPDGVKASDEIAADAGGQKREQGRFCPGDAETTSLARKGGRAKKGTTKLSHTIGPSKLSPDALKRARTLRRTLAAEIAANVGGGYCGVAASLMVKWSSQKTAAAEEAFAAGDLDLFRKLSESARMDLLYAREHAAKEAQSRPPPRVALPVFSRVDEDDDEETADELMARLREEAKK